MKSLRPSFSTSLQDAIAGRPVVAFNIGPLGEAYVVLALEPLDYRDAGSPFPKTEPDAPQRYRVLVVRGGEIETDIVIDGEPFNIHLVQPLGDGELLLACGRSHYRGPEDFELNGRVYTRDGRFLRAFLLGDGIEALQATRRGELWASYFDEGVLGNFGWRDPVGSAGLVAWGGNGEKLYEYEPAAGLDRVIDCYALNVATDDDVWLYYYTDFPLVHLRQRRVVSFWAEPLEGARAFAVGGGHALFAGGYDAPDTFTLVRLEEGGVARKLGQFELLDAEGAVIQVQLVVGRGGSLHLLTDGVLHELTLASVLAQVRR